MLERLDGFETRRYYLSGGRTPASALKALPTRWPRLAAATRGADLLHVHGDVASVLSLPLMRVRPAVLTTHGLHMLRRAEGAPGAMFARAFSAAIAAARGVVCTSQAERDELASHLRAADLDKLRVIHNGIDPPALVEQAEREAIRRELGVGADTLLCVFIGQLEPRKAPVLAALAAQRARGTGTQLELLIAGEGPEEAELRALEGPAVRLLGHRRDVARLLAAADVFVQPSEREGLSFALLEAMSHGAAVVAADSSSAPEVLGDAGLLHPPGDESALADLLTRLATDSTLRASLGAKAQARARERFSADGFLAATRDVYLEVLGRPTAPGPAVAGARV
jgi:glycosyltransferase involved in cell wall biosynthesis